MANIVSRNILYLLSATAWTTRERFAFRDMLLAKNHGHNVLLCTDEDSYVAKLAKNEGIEVVHYRKSFLFNLSSYHKHFSVNSLIKKYKIDIVHSYDFHFLLSLCFQLRSFNLTAFILTKDFILNKPLQRFWYKPLIMRIDALIMINKNLVHDSLGNLGLPKKKVNYYGMGIKDEDAIDPKEMASRFNLYKDYFLVGTFLSPDASDHAPFTTLLAALKVINVKSPGAKQSKLIFITPTDFKTIKYLPTLMNHIEEEELKDDVLFVTTQDLIGVMAHLDMWLMNSDNELIEDYALSALIHEVPALLVRNFCTKDLLEEYEGIGETYKLSDARELRDKWEKIILGKAVYKEKTKLYKFFIEREHSYKTYKNELLNLYAKTVSRRERLFKKK